jgi:hypothetical protein
VDVTINGESYFDNYKYPLLFDGGGGVGERRVTPGRNPVGVDEVGGMMTQGRRWCANLGL